MNHTLPAAKSKCLLHLVAILLIFIIKVPAATGQTVSINEVMASNGETIADMDGDFEDWVEFYNYGNEPVDLEGYGFSDDYDNPFRWIFPSVTIEPGEYLLVWASGKDRRPEGGWINGIMREVWKGITGTAISELVDHPDYPDNPSERHLVTEGFEAPVNIGNHYGQRMHGYIEAPETGDYVFWIASDDNGVLYLSTDDDPGNIVEIASVPGWTNSREWLKYPEQQSTSIMLEEGKRYYIKALMKEHEGGDNLAVRWRLPSGQIEEPIPNSRLYWNETELHTNFRIAMEGEEVLLTCPDSVRVDEIPPTEIPRDISYGRYPDGTGEWFWYTDPTPGQPNHDGGLSELPAIPDPPRFTHDGGPFIDDFMLGFEFDERLEVYYTTDGNEPKPGISRRYSQPFNISRTTIVRAISHEAGVATSKVVKELYTKLTHSTNQFSSNLPLMVIHKFNQTIPDGHPRVPVYITLYDKGEDGRVRLADDPALQSRAVINLRGSSSLMFPKKMYGFHLHEEDGSNRKEALLGMPVEHNWIINGPYSDKSLMRNVIAYGLSNDIGRYSPRTRFIELYLHDGTGPLTDDHYHGVYVLIERIKWADGRVEIEKIGQDDNQEPEITGGYIFKRDRLNPGESGFRTQRGSRFAFARPQESDITVQQKAWLENHLSNFEAALFGDNFTDPGEGYNKYIDPDSFIDAHLITELLKEIDGYRLSTFFYKDRGGKIIKGPLWDFNISMGNVDYYPDPYYTDTAWPRPWEPEGWYYSLLSQNTYLYGWYTRLFEDPEFKSRYNERYWQLRRGQFSNDSLRARINGNAFILTEAQDRNFKRWPILNRYIWPNHYIAPTYNHEITWITNWQMSRTRWMDSQLGPATTLLHFWHFNDLPSDEFFDVSADHSIGDASLTYTGVGNGFMDRVNDGTLLNADLGVPAERALRVRNPSDTRELIFSLPTDGYRDVVFRYAVKRTPNGARNQTVYYRTNDIDNWMPYSDTLKITETYQQFRLNFAGIEETYDNPKFSIRILFHGEEAGGSSGNNRFDNITLDGYSIHDDENGEEPSMEVAAYHYNSRLFIDSPFEGTAHIEVFNVSGHLVGRFQTEGTGLHDYHFAPPGGIYIVRMRNEVHVLRKKIFVHR